MHPSLYPLLMVISRLYPSPLHGIDTSLSMTAFIPLIRRCAHSPVLKTREMAARALFPLISLDIWETTITELVQDLPSKSSQKSHNFTHGVLLQLQQLVNYCDLTFSTTAGSCCCFSLGINLPKVMLFVVTTIMCGYNVCHYYVCE